MSYEARKEYIRTQSPRYRAASKSGKKRILDEGCALFNMHRKSLTRAFHRARHRAGKNGGRPRLYDEAVLQPLKILWLQADQPCSKRLAAMLPAWLPHYEVHYGALSLEVRQALETVSPATIDRLLAPVRARALKGMSGTRSVAYLQGQIPIRTRFQNADGPGWMEADTVAHCGQSMAGAFVWSLTLTDIWSGWTENRAVWNKDHRQVVARTLEIELDLPFDLLGFDSDNGSEFITYDLLRFLRERAVPVEFTRSRPYRKNDNAHVEQKQWTHVRQLLGYDRFDDKRLVAMINDLFANEWRLLQNFFMPSAQLISKSRQEGRIVRKHSAPLTPYERLLRCDRIGEEVKESLRRQYESLDPFVLRQALERKLKAIFQLAARSAKRKHKLTARDKPSLAPQPPTPQM